MERYFEAPVVLEDQQLKSCLNQITIFVAGGISGCPDWQLPLSYTLLNQNPNLVLFNPRRPIFDLTDRGNSEIQIEWEHFYLDFCDSILFWFPKDTLCPITLFEYGYWLAKDAKKLFVGIEPGYQREFDIRYQTQLAPNGEGIVGDIVSSLDDLAQQIIEYYQ